jgi:Bacteriocin-protection, YdeI or OmpD-Associated/Domain of unknown function (DUF1905)
MVEFRAELETTGGATAGFEVQQAVVDELGGGSHPKVVVRVNGFEFRTSIARMGNRFMLGVSKERRAAAGVTPGETLDVHLELDTAPREIEVPQDLAAALAADPRAKAFFDALSYSKQQWHTLQVSGAKQPETRARRVAASVAMLREGRAR